MTFIDNQALPATGNREIDRDHREIAERINAIYAAWQDDATCRHLRPHLEGLLETLRGHFAKEITIARGAGYKAWLEHHQAHAEFLTRLKHFIDKCESCDLGHPLDIGFFRMLEAHLYEHEMTRDQEMWPLWRDAGLAEGEALIPWRAEYAVGIEQIDQQHRFLIQMLNDFHRSLDGLGELAEHHRRLKAILNETERHFRSEEQYFSHLPQEEAERHRLAHDQLLKELMLAIKDRESFDAEALKALLAGYLRFWLLDHIVNIDTKLRDFLR
jgi:hemerythrin